MAYQHEPWETLDEPSKQAAVEVLHKSNCVDSAASLPPSPGVGGKKKKSAKSKTAKDDRGLARLRAENAALRTEVLSLQIQWEILKTTLGMLSTTICTHD